ncbi:MAG: hypothetical protein JSW03_11080 [Candidatus Eiseniibacteriota bacterium]|nr:MAG: hypothetical protein JSW03_11080 [Candidatus Eisenbacteria bacterium]
MVPVYIGSAIIFVWGVGHLVATRSVVAGYGELTVDNRRILTMEWVAEGLTLCFLGVLPSLVAGSGGLALPPGRAAVYAAAAMLFVLAGLSAATGAKTSVVPMKACPIVKTVTAALYVAGVGLAGP